MVTRAARATGGWGTRIQTAASFGTGYVLDEIQWRSQNVPEPGSLALLALGAVGCVLSQTRPLNQTRSTKNPASAGFFIVGVWVTLVVRFQ